MSPTTLSRPSRLFVPIALALVALASLATMMSASPASPPPPEGALLAAEVALPPVIATLHFSPGIGLNPTALGVNASTGYVYVAGPYNTAVLSGTDLVATLDAQVKSLNRHAIGVNPTTGYVYVADDDQTMVLSGTHVITAIPDVGGGAVGVNPTTGYVYVTDPLSNTVTVISGTQVITTLSVGIEPDVVGVNPATGYVYVTDYHYQDYVTVISGTQVITTLATSRSGSGFYVRSDGLSSQETAEAVTTSQNPRSARAAVVPQGGGGPSLLSDPIGVNPLTGYVYVANHHGNTVTVISGTQVITQLVTGESPSAVGVNPVTGYVYVADWGGRVTVISGTQVLVTLSFGVLAEAARPGPAVPMGGGPGAVLNLVGVNPATGYVYVADWYGRIIVISGTVVVASSLAPDILPQAIGVNAATGYVYIADYYNHHVTVISATQVVAAISPGPHPRAVHANPATGYIYVAHQFSNDLTVLSGTQVITHLLMEHSPGPINVNPANGYVYVGRRDAQGRGYVTIISGTQVITTFGIGGPPAAIESNPATGYVYIATEDFKVAVISATQVITTVPWGGPRPMIGVNPATGYVYVASFSLHVSVFSGTQVVATPVVGAYIVALGVNPATGYVYLVHNGGTGVTVLQDTRVVATLPLGTVAMASLGGGFVPATIAVDSLNGYVYVEDPSRSRIAVLSGLQIITNSLLAGTSRGLLGPSPGTGYVYAATSAVSNVAVLQGPQVLGALSVGVGPRAIGFANKRAYIASYEDQSIAVLQEPVMPRALTPRLLDTPEQDIVLEFDAAVATATVQFEISPAMSLTVMWDDSVRRATLAHAPFAQGQNYTVRVLPDGLSASGVPVAAREFDFMYPFRGWLPVMLKSAGW